VVGACVGFGMDRGPWAMASTARIVSDWVDMRRRGIVLLFALGVLLTSAPAAFGGVEDVVYTVLPITAGQAREIGALLGSPETVAGDVAKTTDALIATAATLPAGVLHDLLTTPVRHYHIVRGLVTDGVELVAPPSDGRRGLFRHTIQALHHSRVFSATASAVRRITEPTNRTGRLAIVLTARAYGLAAQDGHLEMLRRAVDRDDPDVGPLLLAVVEMMAKSYGRDAIRVILN
jgi:hypothetical protein